MIIKRNIKNIIDSKIDKNNFMESFLTLLLNHNLITKGDYELIITKLLALLSNKIEKFTGGLTSSVSIKTAVNINESNLWTIGLYLKNMEYEDIVDILTKEDINTIYKKSKAKLDNTISKTKLFYKVIFLKKIIPTNNYFYNATLIKGINIFFTKYNPDYNSKDYLLTIDYNPFLKCPRKYGIEFISIYLEYINYENIFCTHFSSKNINILLKKIYKNYENLPINIFEHVFTISLLLEYNNKNIFNLRTEEISLKKLYNDFYSNSNNYAYKIKKSYNSLMTKINLDNLCKLYIDKCLNHIINKIVFHTSNNSLDTLLGLKESNDIFYFPGEKISDKEFIEILHSINNSPSKIDIIKNNINSLYEVIHIIDTVNFTIEELFALFSSMQIIDLMALKKWYTNYSDNSSTLGDLNRYIYTKSNKEQNIINNNYKYIILEGADNCE